MMAVPGPHDVVRHTLPNGIVLLVRENPDVNSVVIQGALDAGSLYDDPGRDGLASFAAAMLLRGTETRDFQSIHEALESSGAVLAVSAGLHHAAFSGRSLAEDLPLLLDLLADALRRPAFPDEQVERLRGQFVTALKIQEQDPRYVAGRMFREMVYGEGHPYHRPGDGMLESVAAITREHLFAFHQECFGPRGMIMVVVGAIQAGAVCRLVEQHLGDWANAGQRLPPELPSVPLLSGIVRREAVLPGKSQADIVLGVSGPSRFSEDWQAANIANHILGVFGMYGRIGAHVRERLGLAYYSFSRLDGGPGPGPWRVIAGASPANVEAVVRAVEEELRRITTDSVSEGELADSKANLVGRLPLQLESNEGVAGSILSMELYGLGLDYLQRYAPQIEAITAEQVLAAARRYLDPKAYALAVAGPGETAGAA
jgi:zinc protease